MLQLPRAGILIAAAPLVACASIHGPPERSSATAAAVAESLSFDEDMTVFTLFALLNAAGYDEENSDSGMHQVRLEVRRSLARQLDAGMKNRLSRFYTANRSGASTWHYSVVAMATNGPPSFEPTQEWAREISSEPEFARLAELHGLLREFYAAADVPSLYRRVRPAYRTYIDAYDQVVRRETAAVLAYLRIAPEAHLAPAAGHNVRARVIPNLLDSFERALSFNLQGRFISLEGPQHAIGYNPHEFIHAVTNAVSYDPRHTALQSRAAILLPEARVALGDDNSTRSVAAFMDECLVRAIALRYRGAGHAARLARLESAMTEECRRGYIMERFFWEQLVDLEGRAMSLSQIYPIMLARLDPSAELGRWRAARTRSRPRT